MRILIVSYFFPPYNTIGAIRTGKTAKYLERLGHDVRVLTALEPSLEVTVPRGLEVEIAPEKIIATGWLDFNRMGKSWIRKLLGDRPLEHLADEGTPLVKQSGPIRIGIARAAALYRNVVNFPDGKIGWIPIAHREARKRLGDWRPDFVIASSPPPTSLLVARRLARSWGVPWVAEMRDLWTDNPDYTHPDWRHKLEHSFEDRILRSARALVTVSEPLAEALRRRGEQPVQVVKNGFDREDYPALRSRVASDEPLTIAYTGSLYEKGQDPAVFFQAIETLGELVDQVRIVFYSPVQVHGFIRQRQAAVGPRVQVELNERIPLRDCLRVQAESDILLHFLWSDPAERGFYSGKLFDYIGARRPILAIGPAANVGGELILERKVGVVLSSCAEIADWLRARIAEKRRTGIPSVSSAPVDDLSREAQTRVLEGFLKGLLETPLKPL